MQGSPYTQPSNPTEILPFDRLGPMLQSLLEEGDIGPMRMVDTLLAQAAGRHAGDIHIEPWEEAVSIRFRMDGILHPVAHLPRTQYPRMVGRIKVLARMLSYQKDLPQDGRIDPESTPCGRAVRVSTFPTVHGEKLVLRILNPESNLFTLDALGFSSDITESLRRLILRPQGTLLLTGPASSGKTTTIYALLHDIAHRCGPTAHVMTIEDPVEYRLGKVSQTEIHPAAGFTHEAALRAALRQDPEVIMIGEIRDPETARTAIQAGLTGHLIISTLHSGVAAGVFTRLLDMGIEPYLAASSVTGILSQRLYRKVCPACAVVRPATAEERLRYRLETRPSVLQATGCPECLGIGYRSRAALGEFLPVSESIEALLLTRPRTQALHEAAVTAGMRTLFERAVDAVHSGHTTPEEIERLFPSGILSPVEIDHTRTGEEE